MTTVRELLTQLTQLTGERRDARLLLALVLERTPAEISARSGDTVPGILAAEALNAGQRLSAGEPMAYATGKAAFRNLLLDVDRRVLIPRPETEVVVDEVLRLSTEHPGGTAVDIGTGSGAIAISLATEGHFDRVIATDISSEALAVAEQNAMRECNLSHKRGSRSAQKAVNSPVQPEFRQGDGYAPLAGVKARVIVSNPPYIAYDEARDLPELVAGWEPALALFAEDGGMAMYDVLLDGAPEHLEDGGWIVLEVDSRRAELTASRAAATGFYRNIRLMPDLTGRQRVLTAQLRG